MLTQSRIDTKVSVNTIVQLFCLHSSVVIHTSQGCNWSASLPMFMQHSDHSGKRQKEKEV